MGARSEVRGLPETDDEVLMARFAAGDHDAFEALYERYEAPVFSFCLRLLGDRDLAEDAFQDTFMSLVDQRFRYRDSGRLRGWLFTIARNVCLDRLRLVERRTKLLSLHATSGSPRRDDPERAVESRDELSRVLAAIPPDQREVLLLHWHAGFSYAEIAQMMSSTEAAVKQKAHRATLALRSSVQG